MTFETLSKFPFNLDATQLNWVRERFAALSVDDKLRQLFNLRSAGTDPDEIGAIRDFRPGGVTRHIGAGIETERAIIAGLGAGNPTPLLISADLEGSRMSLQGGAEFPNPLALAAVDDVEATAEVSRLMALEARYVDQLELHTGPRHQRRLPQPNRRHSRLRFGCRHHRAPCADPDARLPAERCRLCHQALAGRGFRRSRPAPSHHHQPPLDRGVGGQFRPPLPRRHCSGRTQRHVRPHCLPGLRSFAGARCRRRGLPPGDDQQGPQQRAAARPARLQRPHRLGCHLDGRPRQLVETLGIPARGHRERLRRHLFSNDPADDLGYLEAALADGRLSQVRVDAAIIRQLGMKAKLGLNAPDTMPPGEAPNAAATQYAAGIIRRAPTLVKDVTGLLPINPGKHKRVLIVSGGIVFPFTPQPLPFALPEMLRQHGFEVEICGPETQVSPENHDLMLYLLGEETLLTRGRIFLDWLKLTGHFGKSMARYWHDIPTVMISFGYPYMLYDAPRVPTYINAYSTTETMQRAVVDALLGTIPFNLTSPVDPFCGLEDARY